MMSYIFFAKWFGVISVILSLGILFNLDDAKIMAKRMVEEESGYVMGGVLPIIFGSFGFMHQHSFEMGWQTIVTVISLSMMLAGMFRVLFVQRWKELMHRHLDQIPPLFSLFGLMFGVLLLYVGFFSPLL